MTRIARIASFVGLLVVLTGCPDPNRPFTITLAPTPAGYDNTGLAPLPSGGVFFNVKWWGYVWNGSEGVSLTPQVIYPDVASFSYGYGQVGNRFSVDVEADYWVPNLEDPENPTVYHVSGFQSWVIADEMNGGIPIGFAIPVYKSGKTYR